MILDNAVDFIKGCFSELDSLEFDYSQFKIDHIGFQANSKNDYTQKLIQLKDRGDIVSESIVGNRRVAIFKLSEPINYESSAIEVVEIIELKEGQIAESAWEHLELIEDGNLENILKTYSSLNCDTSAINRNEFPMLILKINDRTRVKFPRLGVLEEVQRLGSKSI